MRKKSVKNGIVKMKAPWVPKDKLEPDRNQVGKDYWPSERKSYWKSRGIHEFRVGNSWNQACRCGVFSDEKDIPDRYKEEGEPTGLLFNTEETKKQEKVHDNVNNGELFS